MMSNVIIRVEKREEKVFGTQNRTAPGIKQILMRLHKRV